MSNEKRAEELLDILKFLFGVILLGIGILANETGTTALGTILLYDLYVSQNYQKKEALK